MLKYYNHENSSKVIWPHDGYNPIHADCFMQSVLISGKGLHQMQKIHLSIR